MAEKEYVNLRELVGELVDKYAKRTAWGSWEKSLVDSILTTICRVPAADVVEVKHGEWVEGAEHFTNGFYEAECSVCGNYIRWNEGNSGEWNYCPNCGAKMDGGKTE